MTTEQVRECLWQPSEARIGDAALTGFMEWINRRHGLQLRDYSSLWRWSVQNIEAFWAGLAAYYKVFPEAVAEPVLQSREMPGARWFPNVNCNFAEYLLAQGERDAVAVHHESEARPPGSLTRAELERQVRSLAASLRALGVQPGDRVVGYLPTSPEALIGLLATTAIGAVWSCCSPDFGSKSVIERFSQLQPKVLIAISGYVYNSKYCDRSEQLAEIVSALPSLEQVVHVPYGDALAAPAKALSWDALVSASFDAEFAFAQLPFDHPLWVLFTSGTTGLPKGIVHGHGGVLLEFVKSGRLHDDLGPGSVKFYYTSTGWTMFNLLIGGLVTGAAVVLYDGQPVHPDTDRLWRLAEDYRLTYFGASPAYIKIMMDRQYQPGALHDLSALRTLALTGSPASEECFRWIYRHVASDLHVVSMSGGTDVATAFVGGVPTMPVHAGELQAPALAVAAAAWDESGKPLANGEEGELVVTEPMPSMPTHFWNDPDNERYRGAYFEMFPGSWRQGDLIRFSEDGMGSVITGRSDSTLNRQGSRIGTAEIYRVVEAMEGIADSLVLHLEQADGWMPLFVVMQDGYELDEALKRRICDELRRACSGRHVPDDVIEVAEIPYTLSGKKLEVPVKRILLGVPITRAVNQGAVANPEAISAFVALSRTTERLQKV